MRLVHGSLVGGVAVIMTALAFVREVAAPAARPDLLPVFRAVAFAELAVAIVVARVLWARIPSRARATDEAAWWRDAAGPAVVVWSLAEGSALLGGVLWFLTGDPWILIGVTGVALAILVASRPGRLAER